MLPPPIAAMDFHSGFLFAVMLVGGTAGLAGSAISTSSRLSEAIETCPNP